jgi:hypothetical protein
MQVTGLTDSAPIAVGGSTGEYYNNKSGSAPCKYIIPILEAVTPWGAGRALLKISVF